MAPACNWMDGGSLTNVLGSRRLRGRVISGRVSLIFECLGSRGYITYVQQILIYLIGGNLVPPV